MDSSEISSTTEQPPKYRLLDRWARDQVLKRLQNLKGGQIEWIDPIEHFSFGDPNAATSEKVFVFVKNMNFYSDLAFGGTVGAGESWISHHWDCSNLTQLIEILLRNQTIVDGIDSRISPLKNTTLNMFHWFNRNTLKGSKRNIEAHYDLGNELFELFLDPAMMYSCAYYPKATSTLDEAANAKLERICQKLQLSPEDHLLEIGTGWGGLAIHAAKHYGCRVTTTTLSKEQYNLAKQRVAQEGLGHLVTLLMEDYRELQGQYDKLVSVEMIEAIGAEYQDTYFAKCSHLLKPDGLMVLQAITIRDQRYESALKTVDFIKRHIFPGCFMPAVASMAVAIANSTDMKIVQLEDIGPHYARTLADWRKRFLDNISQVKRLGYSEEFIRKWLFYFAYCEAGFSQRILGDVQLILTKPENRLDLTGLC